MRKLLIQLSNPLALVRIPQDLILMPLAHELATYYFRFPLNDSVIGRIATYIRESQGSLVYVDVGANIGDSAFCVTLGERDISLLLEPTKVYRECAATNLSRIAASVEIIDCLAGAYDADLEMATSAARGTARFTPSRQASPGRLATIDALVGARPHLKPNFIKIDTDGHDLACLEGAKRRSDAFILTFCLKQTFLVIRPIAKRCSAACACSRKADTKTCWFTLISATSSGLVRSNRSTVLRSFCCIS